MNFVVYILYSEKLQRYYVGQTSELEGRLNRHNSGQTKYTSKGIPWSLVKTYACIDRKGAVNLELKIKKRGIKRYLLEH